MDSVVGRSKLVFVHIVHWPLHHYSHSPAIVVDGSLQPVAVRIDVDVESARTVGSIVVTAVFAVDAHDQDQDTIVALIGLRLD